jgi:site-specific DNA recombinase
MTVGIYIRVSTLEQAQEGYSIAAQKERLLAFCAAQGWTEYRFYVDEGVSAKDTNRPQLNLLFDHIKSGQIKMILVYRLDRFTRRVVDLHNMLEEMEQYKCAFKSATEPYDTSTAMGRMFIGLVALLAQWETENLSERIKMALDKKVSDGERVGNIPFGFNLSEKETLVKNIKQATVVLEMIKMVKGGKSASQIAAHLTRTNNDRVRWHAQGVLRVLRNPALYGATRWNGKVFEDTHVDEAIISKAEFNKLQQMLDDRSVHRLREVESTYVFQGVLICPTCNSPLSVNRYVRKKKDGSQYQGALYKCQNCYREGRQMISLGEQRILEALYSYMKNFTLENIEVPETNDDEYQKLIDHLRQIEKKREKYQRAWAADLMTDDEFNKLMSETRMIFEELKDQISSYDVPSPVNPDAIKDIVYTFNQSFFYLIQEEKRLFVSQFIRKIEFKLISQSPKRPDKAKKGKDQVIITNVEFY